MVDPLYRTCWLLGFCFPQCYLLFCMNVPDATDSVYRMHVGLTAFPLLVLSAPFENGPYMCGYLYR